MNKTEARSNTTAAALRLQLEQHRRNRAWNESVALLDQIPETFDASWLETSDEMAFALGHHGDRIKAAALLEQAWKIEPTARRASTLAYLHYAAALARRSGSHQENVEDLEAIRQEFRRWIGEALRLNPKSIKDLYRLGIFEAVVESCHDKAALKALTAAIDCFRSLPSAARLRRSELRKYYVRALYAAGRSSLRLEYVLLARRSSFDCIREDRDTDYVTPLHKFGLGGRVCLASGQLDHAERAFRLALDAKGPPAREYVFGYLAEVARQRGDIDVAKRWIEANVRPERRSAALWRQLGDLQRGGGDLRAAESSYRASLLKDRAGRHLTFTRLGEILRAQDRVKEAERAFRDAIAFRRRSYQSTDRAATLSLIDLLDAHGRAAEAEDLRRQLENAAENEPRASQANGRKGPRRAR